MENFEKLVSGNAKIQSYFFMGAFFAVTILSFFILKPFLIPFVLAVVFAIFFKEFYFKILKFFKNKASLSSFVMILMILLLILVPLTFISIKIFSQASEMYVNLDTNGGGFVEAIKDFSHQSFNKVSRYLGAEGSNQVLSADFDRYIKQGADWILSNFSAFFSSLALFIFNIAIFVIMLYYIFKHGAALKEFAVRLSPLSDKKDMKIIDRLEQSINSILRSSVVIALIQGILAGIGFTIFGVPQPALWGLLAGICAFIPGFGTSLVLIPVIIYLGVFGSLVNTIGMAIWGIFAVGLVDNFFAPWLMSKGSNIHPFLILLSVLGGLIFFGPIGFLLGPLTLSLLLTLFEIYFIEAQAN